MEKIAYEVVEWKCLKQDYFFKQADDRATLWVFKTKTFLEGIREVIRL